jgi:hypothetical protein
MDNEKHANKEVLIGKNKGILSENAIEKVLIWQFDEKMFTIVGQNLSEKDILEMAESLVKIDS